MTISKNSKRSSRSPAPQSPDGTGTESSEPKLHPWQRWEPATVHRSELRNAPYNPRTIKVESKRRLKKVLGSLGLIEGLVWNARTGNLVGGHQRLSVLDAAAGTHDYLLTVCKVDLSDEEEERGNLALNNWSAQGDFDPEKLKVLLQRHQEKLEDTGFDATEVMNLFGSQVGALESQRLQQMADKLREARATVAKMQESADKRDCPDYYFVAVFRDPDELQEFLTENELELNRFQRGETLRRICREGRKSCTYRGTGSGRDGAEAAAPTPTVQSTPTG